MMRTGWCWEESEREIWLASACLCQSDKGCLTELRCLCFTYGRPAEGLLDPVDSFVVQCVLGWCRHPIQHGTSVILSLFLFPVFHTPVRSIVLTLNKSFFYPWSCAEQAKKAVSQQKLFPPQINVLLRGVVELLDWPGHLDRNNWCPITSGSNKRIQCTRTCVLRPHGMLIKETKELKIDYFANSKQTHTSR